MNIRDIQNGFLVRYDCTPPFSSETSINQNSDRSWWFFWLGRTPECQLWWLFAGIGANFWLNMHGEILNNAMSWKAKYGLDVGKRVF